MANLAKPACPRKNLVGVWPFNGMGLRQQYD
jgi:hypothetical protein